MCYSGTIVAMRKQLRSVSSFLSNATVYPFLIGGSGIYSLCME